jgi:hypothetical protein
MKPALALVLVPILAAACVADVRDSAEEPQAVGNVAEPVKDPLNLANLPKTSPCGTACLMIAAGRCGSWQDECIDAYPYQEDVDCGTGVTLSCVAARDADQDTAVGVMGCYRECEHLHN